MKIRLLLAAVLSATILPAVAHDPAAHSRRTPAVPAECAALVGKDPTTIELKDPAVKAAQEKCEAAKKEAREAAEVEHDH